MNERPNWRRFLLIVLLIDGLLVLTAAIITWGSHLTRTGFANTVIALSIVCFLAGGAAVAGGFTDPRSAGAGGKGGGYVPPPRAEDMQPLSEQMNANLREGMRLFYHTTIAAAIGIAFGVLVRMLGG